MSPILRRPSIAVTAWGALVLGIFAWRGDLRLAAAPETAADASSAKAQPAGPLVVRREGNVFRQPHVLRAGRVFDSLGYLVVGAEVVGAEVVAPEGAAPAPVAGAAESAGSAVRMRPDSGDSRARGTIRTGSDGSFELLLPTQRVCDVLVRAEGKRPVWKRTTAAAPDSLTVLLEPEAPWDDIPQPPSPASGLRGEGTVRDVEGRALAKAYVNVVGTQCWAQTDDIGRYELALPSTRATLRVQSAADLSMPAGGFEALSAPFVSSRARGVVPLPELAVVPAGSIRGIVHGVDGRPVADLPVRIHGAGFERTVETNAVGVFVLSGLPAADFTVEAFAYRREVGEPLSVRVDRSVVECDVKLQRLEDAGLRVTDRDGVSLPGLWVAAARFGSRTGVGQTDSNGRVQLPMAAKLAAKTAFEVRAPRTFARFDVVRFDADADVPTLVVAMQ
ncbi:MAG: carboxypeptidase-like regulatory domain-containing protein [Planctomycetota bacterium]